MTGQLRVEKAAREEFSISGFLKRVAGTVTKTRRTLEKNCPRIWVKIGYPNNWMV